MITDIANAEILVLRLKHHHDMNICVNQCQMIKGNVWVANIYPGLRFHE